MVPSFLWSAPQILKLTTDTCVDGVELVDCAIVIAKVCFVILSWEWGLWLGHDHPHWYRFYSWKNSNTAADHTAQKPEEARILCQQGALHRLTIILQLFTKSEATKCSIIEKKKTATCPKIGNKKLHITVKIWKQPVLKNRKIAEYITVQLDVWWNCRN